AIYLAARQLGVRLPEGEVGAWWELFDCDRDPIMAVSTGILGLYQLPKAKWVNVRGDAKAESAEKDKEKKPDSKSSEAAGVGGEAMAALAAALAAEKGLIKTDEGLAAGKKDKAAGAESEGGESDKTGNP
ncbi:hypothetical protein T484DRAFT_1858909, partial [Baffinella frigidus]